MNASDQINQDGRIRACHVTSGHEVTDTRVFRRECGLLRDDGYDISLIAQNTAPEKRQGITIEPLPMVGVRWYKRWITLLPILWKIMKGRYDMVHFHDPDLLPVMVAYSWLSGKPVIWDAHENFGSVIADGNKLRIRVLSRLAGWTYSRFELIACRIAGAYVVTVSQPMADRYKRANLEAIACPNYVDHRLIPFPPRVDRSTPPLIIMTGNMRGDAFEIHLVEAFSILKKKMDCRLAFWGEIHPALRKALIKKARDFNVEDSVEFAGPFPWEQLVTHLIPQCSAAVYVADPGVPQRLLEVPNRIFEYWANGVPVIVSNGTLCGEIVYNANGGLTVDYGVVQSLTEALERLLSNPNLSSELGNNGRRAVLDRFSWIRAGSKLIDLYRRVSENGAC